MDHIEHELLPNYYAALDVSYHASIDDIQQAFLRRADDLQTFYNYKQTICDAFMCLCNPADRDAYDAYYFHTPCWYSKPLWIAYRNERRRLDDRHLQFERHASRELLQANEPPASAVMESLEEKAAQLKKQVSLVEEQQQQQRRRRQIAKVCQEKENTTKLEPKRRQRRGGQRAKATAKEDKTNVVAVDNTKDVRKSDDNPQKAENQSITGMSAQPDKLAVNIIKTSTVKSTHIIGMSANSVGAVNIKTRSSPSAGSTLTEVLKPASPLVTTGLLTTAGLLDAASPLRTAASVSLTYPAKVVHSIKAVEADKANQGPKQSQEPAKKLANSRWADPQTCANGRREHPQSNWQKKPGQVCCASCGSEHNSSSYRCTNCNAAFCRGCYLDKIMSRRAMK